ncbi:hypothetical protein DXG03_000159 [Asterophora parasitica]|uniref:Uncharacterized protein n=1 Tax=Asterophora parasitica TaxID=117018 RepID=A0A9P7KHH7_9AGAR|nr:hypothetical protein DXG03_000159 [Asterophora parasitica]
MDSRTSDSASHFSGLTPRGFNDASTLRSGGAAGRGHSGRSTEESWRGSERTYSRASSRAGRGMEVVRVGGGSDAARSMTMERASGVPEYHPWREDNARGSDRPDNSYRDNGYQATATRATYDSGAWRTGSTYGQRQYHSEWAMQSSSSPTYHSDSPEDWHDGSSDGSYASSAASGTVGGDRYHASYDAYAYDERSVTGTGSSDDFYYEGESGFTESHRSDGSSDGGSEFYDSEGESYVSEYDYDSD